MTKYLIDTNVFVQAIDKFKCLKFLEWVRYANEDGIASSVQAVFREIKSDGTLNDWKCENRNIFLNPTGQVPSKITRVADWANRVKWKGYAASSIRSFCNGADHILVAHACVIDSIVVTQETRDSSGNRKKLKIPDACDEFNVGCMTAEEMLEEEQPEFFLDFQRHSVA